MVAVALSEEDQHVVIVGYKDQVSLGSKSWVAARQIKNWAILGSGLGNVEKDTLVRLYMSVREVAGEGVTISPQMLQHLHNKLERSASLSRKLWLVQKENQVSDKISRYIVRRRSISEWPPMDIDPEGVVVYDIAVPQIELGLNVMEFSISRE